MHARLSLHPSSLRTCAFLAVPRFSADCSYCRARLLSSARGFQPTHGAWNVSTGHMADVRRVAFHPNPSLRAPDRTTRSLCRVDVTFATCVPSASHLRRRNDVYRHISSVRAASRPLSRITATASHRHASLLSPLPSPIGSSPPLSHALLFPTVWLNRSQGTFSGTNSLSNCNKARIASTWSANPWWSFRCVPVLCCSSWRTPPPSARRRRRFRRPRPPHHHHHHHHRRHLRHHRHHRPRHRLVPRPLPRHHQSPPLPTTTLTTTAIATPTRTTPTRSGPNNLQHRVWRRRGHGDSPRRPLRGLPPGVLQRCCRWRQTLGFTGMGTRSLIALTALMRSAVRVASSRCSSRHKARRCRASRHT